jgi:hypothetical protein
VKMYKAHSSDYAPTPSCATEGAASGVRTEGSGSGSALHRRSPAARRRTRGVPDRAVISSESRSLTGHTVRALTWDGGRSGRLARNLCKQGFRGAISSCRGPRVTVCALLSCALRLVRTICTSIDPVRQDVERSPSHSSMGAAGWLPLRHCPGRAEPVKGAYGVGFAADP